MARRWKRQWQLWWPVRVSRLQCHTSRVTLVKNQLVPDLRLTAPWRHPTSVVGTCSSFYLYSLQFYFSFKLFSHIFLKGRETETETFPPWIHSANACIDWGSPNLKLELSTQSMSPMYVVRFPVLELGTAACQGAHH